MTWEFVFLVSVAVRDHDSEGCHIFAKILEVGRTKYEHRFEGSHYPKDVILYAVFFYARYAVSYRDLEEILAECGVQVDHATLKRWVVEYSPDIAKAAQMRKQPAARSWRMDETYIKVKGRSRGTTKSRSFSSPCRNRSIKRSLGEVKRSLTKLGSHSARVNYKLLPSRQSCAKPTTARKTPIGSMQIPSRDAGAFPLFCRGHRRGVRHP